MSKEVEGQKGFVPGGWKEKGPSVRNRSGRKRWSSARKGATAGSRETYRYPFTKAAVNQATRGKKTHLLEGEGKEPDSEVPCWRPRGGQPGGKIFGGKVLCHLKKGSEKGHLERTPWCRNL